MKKFILTTLICCLTIFACKKTSIKNETQNEDKQFCAVIGEYSSKPIRASGKTSELLTGEPVVLLDFDGFQLQANHFWNNNQPYNCAPSGLEQNQAAMDEIQYKAQDHFAALNITVTTDESLYNAAPSNARTRVVFTTSTEIFNGYAAAVSLLGAFVWNNPDMDPGVFVFPQNNNDVDEMAAAVCHEVGHTMWLKHNIKCINGQNFGYHDGFGWQIIPPSNVSYVPLMGLANGPAKIWNWWEGDQQDGCGNIQNDLTLMAGYVGYRPDDLASDFSNPRSLTFTRILPYKTGIMNYLDDGDMWVNNTGAKISIEITSKYAPTDPYYAPVDLKAEVYNSSQVLIATYDPSENAQIPTFLVPIGAYVKVLRSTTNPWMPASSMTGYYFMRKVGP